MGCLINNEYKKIKHIGVYGIIEKNNKVILINKVGGPYDGMLDLPGGSIKFGEKIEDALIREIKEETGLNVSEYKLLDTISIIVSFNNNGSIELINHIGIIYKINKYSGKIIKDNIIDDVNDDSLGACYYSIDSLNHEILSNLSKEAFVRLNLLK